MMASRKQQRDRGRARRWRAAASAGVVACAALLALAGCGSSSEQSGGSLESGKATTSDGDPTAAAVAAATRGLRTASFKGRSTTVGNRYKWGLAVRGRIDRGRKRSAILVYDTLRSKGASTEYRVFGNTVYLRQLTPLPGRWVRQDVRKQGPGGSLPYALATGGIFGSPLRLIDPLKKVSKDSVGGVSVTQYRAKVRKPKAEASPNSATPSTAVQVWLDGRNRVRRLRFGIGSTSKDPALGGIGEQVSVDFSAINRPVKVRRPR